MGEKLTLLAVVDFGEGAAGYLTNDGVRLLPAPTTVRPQMYVRALETIKARRAGRFEEVEKTSKVAHYRKLGQAAATRVNGVSDRGRRFRLGDVPIAVEI